METGVTNVLCINGRNKPLGTVVPVSHERVKMREESILLVESYPIPFIKVCKVPE